MSMPVLNYGLSHIADGQFVLTEPIAVNLPVLAFTALLAVLTGVLFSCLPALQFSPALNDDLRDGQRSVASGRNHSATFLPLANWRWRWSSCSARRCCCAAFRSCLPSILAFVPIILLAVKIDLPANLYSKPEQVESFSTRLQEQAEHIPGVTSAAHHQRAAIDAIEVDDALRGTGRAATGAGQLFR